METVVASLVVICAAVICWSWNGKEKEKEKGKNVSAAALDFTELPDIEGRYTLHLSGEQFDGRQYTIGRLAPGDALCLRREAHNPYDSNAVMVTMTDGNLIGYIPRRNSSWVARLLDEGNDLRATVACVFDDDFDGVMDVQVHIDGVPDPRRVSRKAASSLTVSKSKSDPTRLFRMIHERSDWVILDTETTGLTETGEVVELAIVAADGSILMDQLIVPKGRIPSEATAIHGISRRMLKHCPTWKDVNGQICSALMNKVVITYNAEFDERLIRQSAARWGLPPPATGGFECAMLAYAAHRRVPHTRRAGEFRWHKLGAACRHEGVAIAGAHRALADVTMTRSLIMNVAEAYRVSA